MAVEDTELLLKVLVLYDVACCVGDAPLGDVAHLGGDVYTGFGDLAVIRSPLYGIVFGIYLRQYFLDAAVDLQFEDKDISVS